MAVAKLIHNTHEETDVSISKCLKNSGKNYDWMQSFEKLHYIAKRATPEMMLKYRHALLLHRIFNDSSYGEDWLQLNINQKLNVRNLNFITVENSRYKVGKNIVSNRFKILNNEFILSNLNDSYTYFKIKMRKQYLTY